MGNRGRYGKYGEIKRLARLRQARLGAHLPHGSLKNSLKQTRPFKRPRYERTSVKIRLADPSDSPFIEGLSGRVFSVYGSYEDTLIQWLNSERTLTLIAVMNGRVVGFAMISRLPQEWIRENASELLAIAVEPEVQGLGIGRALILEVEKRAKNLNLSRLFLHTARENSRAIGLFMEMGYRLLGIKKDFYPKGQDGMLMAKEIELRDPFALNA